MWSPKRLMGNKVFIGHSYQCAMQTALKAFIVSVIALTGLVAIPAVMIYANDVGTPTLVLATAIVGLLLGSVIFLARSMYLQSSAYSGSSSSARWLAQMRSTVSDERRSQPVPIFVILLLGTTPVVQWAFLVFRPWSQSNAVSAAICLAIGAIGMSGVAIWNLRRSELGNPPGLSSAPWRVVGLGVAGFSLIAFEALTKHSFLATVCAFLLIDLLSMRLVVVCVKKLTLPSR